MHLVNAQQARRILDRLVGYELSPFLWKKVARGLSAGRVQSVAVRLIVEREREIKAFNPEEYWSLEADLAPKNDSKKAFKARLNKINGKTLDKFHINNEEKALAIFNQLENTGYAVAEIEKKQNKKNPPAPFTTSTLQQSANRMLGFSAKQTMMLAQQLYEGLDLGGDSGGLITYMRTDSLNLSESFLGAAQEYLKKNLGDDYTLKSPRHFKTKSKGAQEAHEAIRPTEAGRDPESLKNKLDNNQYRLYKLIWQRAIASQMPEAILDATTIDIDAKGSACQFRATGQIIAFDGYLRIYPEQSKELELPDIKKGEELDLIQLIKEQHFTKPPARYSDAGIVKAMEKYGIGRPSTYAPTLATIIARNYVNRDESKKLYPTDIAFVVNDLLTAHFQNIVDFEFTAKMEENLDKIAEGAIAWQPIIKDFYDPFHALLEEKANTLKKEDIMPEEKSSEICDKCGASMIIKTGRYGKFYACSAFPDCKNIKGMNQNAGHESDPEKAGQLKVLEEKYKNEACDKCGSAMAIKNGRFGPFLACTAYPKCKNIKSIKENSGSTGIKCPACGKGEIVQKRSKRGAFYACDQYPDCKTAYFAKPTGKTCPDCKALLIEAKGGVKCSSKGCGYGE